MRPLISVIVPVYNVAPYLRQCVESILSQSYQHLEVLLVDDGSTDESGRICDDYASQDKRVRVIHKQNGGLSSARNVGLQHATGEWIAFVDSDDWIEPELFARCLQEIDQHPDLDLVRFGFNCCYPQGEEHSLTYRKEPFLELEGRTDVYPEDLFCGKGAILATVWSSLYRASVLKKLGITFIEGLIHEDEYFTAELYARMRTLKARKIDVYGYNYRLQRSGAITFNQDYLRSLDHLGKGFQSLLKRLSTVDPLAVPVLNTYALYIVELKTNLALSSGYSLEAICNVLAPFFAESRRYRLGGFTLEHRILYRVFSISPQLFHRLGWIYQPIARRLGSRVYT